MKRKLLHALTIGKLSYISIFSLLIFITNPSFSQKDLSWAKSINGNGNDYSLSLTKSINNTVVFGGFFTSTNTDFDPGTGSKILSSYGGEDIFVACFDRNGKFKKAFNIGGSSDDELSSLAVDMQGNIYITGWYKSTSMNLDPGLGSHTVYNNGGTDIFVAKYDSNLNFIWGFSIGGTGNDAGYSLNTDQFNNLYLTGVFRNTISDFDPGPGIKTLISNGDADIFMAKFNISGTLKWVKSIGGSGWDLGLYILPDLYGNFYLTGRFFGSNVNFDPGTGTVFYTDNGNGDYFIAKYDSNCNYKWVSIAGGNQSDNGQYLAFDSKGYIYSVGVYTGTNIDFDPGSGSKTLTSLGGSDAFVAKYDINGNIIWANSYGGTLNDLNRAIAIDNKDNIFVTGYFNSPTLDADPGPGTMYLNNAGNNDIFLIEMNTSGNTIWATSFGGPGNDMAYGIDINKYLSLYLTGSYSSASIDLDPSSSVTNLTSAGTPDIFIAKYASYIPALVITKQAKLITSNSAQLNGLVNADSIDATVTFEYGISTVYGFTVNAFPNIITGKKWDTAIYNLSGLLPNTKYHYRIVAQNESGFFYGRDTFFITLPIPPEAITDPATGIYAKTALLNGHLKANNSHTIIYFNLGLTKAYGKKINSIPDTANGMSWLNVRGPSIALLPNRIYHYQIVTINLADTTKGNDMIFMTMDTVPSIITQTITSYANNTAWSGGIITDLGGSNVITRGICWDTTTNPTISDSFTNNGIGYGSYSSKIMHLIHGVKYYVRAYAINAAGIVYGNELYFIAGTVGVNDELLSSQIILYSENGTIYIKINSLNNIKNHVLIFDILGNKIIDQIIENNELNAFQISNKKSKGIFLVNIIPENNNKIIIRKLFVP